MLDGAIGERGVTRSKLLGSGAVAAAGLLSGGIVAGGFAAPASSSQNQRDVEVLNFALAFEELQASFYARALRDLRLHGEWLQFARVVGGHEREHVAFLRQALGSAAHPAPRFELTRQPSGLKDFQRVAIGLEDTGVALYNGQAGNVTPATLAAAAQIVSVEARHASWARDLAGEIPAPVASEVPADIAQVRAKLAQVGVRVA
jgi:truncated hemoglobin YjbI